MVTWTDRGSRSRCPCIVSRDFVFKKWQFYMKNCKMWLKTISLNITMSFIQIHYIWYWCVSSFSATHRQMSSITNQGYYALLCTSISRRREPDSCCVSYLALYIWYTNISICSYYAYICTCIPNVIPIVTFRQYLDERGTRGQARFFSVSEVCPCRSNYIEFPLPISLVMIVRMCVLDLIIIIKSKVWIVSRCLGLGHETM